jgi:hypothetical protein
MEEIMSGEATPAQIAAFVTALRMKGETADELAGMASVMRARATPVKVSGPTIDIVGTGGDSSGSFNLSTGASLLVCESRKGSEPAVVECRLLSDTPDTRAPAIERVSVCDNE